MIGRLRPGRRADHADAAGQRPAPGEEAKGEAGLAGPGVRPPLFGEVTGILRGEAAQSADEEPEHEAHREAEAGDHNGGLEISDSATGQNGAQSGKSELVDGRANPGARS